MPPKVYNIDVRSHDRDRSRFPSANNFSVDLGHTYYNVTSIKLGSMEVPKTRYTLEDVDNSCYFSEGLAIGDCAMDQPYNAIAIQWEGEAAPTDLVIPATMMPIDAFTGNQMTTPQKHGLEKFMQWSAQDPSRPKAVLVGAEPGPRATAAHRVGFFLHNIPGLSFPTETTISFEEGYIQSVGIGASSPGFIHVPPLHVQEILSLLNFIRSGDRWRIQEGSVRIGQYKDEAVTITSTKDPAGGRRISLGPLLGFNAPSHGGPFCRFPPYTPRAQVPAGFYANPPSLIANATEEALMNRCLFAAESSFKIQQMDAFLSESVTIPQGLYTPELLAQVLRARVTDTTFVMEHVDAEGKASERYVRWTVSSSENFPFTLDFSDAKSVAAARVFGFRQRRYTGQTAYVGEAYAITATYNVMPAPAPSPLNGAQDGALRNAIKDELRYVNGVYTITGTTPSRQTFSLFTESSESWAVPNRGTSKTYYESLRNRGVISITTKNMARAQSYGFKRGDVMRLTGISQESVPLTTIVDVGLKPAQIAGQDVLNGVVAVVANKMGGDGYIAVPEVSIVTDPLDGGERPTITATLRDGKIVAYSLSGNVGARFDRIPTLAVQQPQSFTVEQATFALQSNPERKVLTVTLSAAPTVDVAGKAAVISGSTGLDRLYRVASHGGGAQVVLEQEDLDGAALTAQNMVGATCRFSVSDIVPIATVAAVNGVNTVTFAGNDAMGEATIGKAVRLSGVVYGGTPVEITALADSTFSHAGASDVSAGDRLILRGTSSDGVWIVDTVPEAGKFTLVGGGPTSLLSGSSFVDAADVEERAPVNVGLTVARPLSRPTAAFQFAGDALEEAGFGGFSAFAPVPTRAHARPFMKDDSMASVISSVPGFLNASLSTTNLSSTGGPQVNVSGGSTVSDVFNTRTVAEISSVTEGGELISGNDSHVRAGENGEAISVIFGEFLSSTELRLVLSRAVPAEDSGEPLLVRNFYFDSDYASWSGAGTNTVTITNVDGWASLTINGEPLDPTTAGALLPSTMLVEWPGQYTTAADSVVSGIDITNNVTTRIGVVTYVGYEGRSFRYVIEYNAAGVNGGRGFHDSIGNNRNIFLTFSRLFSTRTEWFGASSSAMHRLTREGRMLTKFQNQILLQRLGVTADVFGETNYVADSQWWLDSMPYRLIQILDDTDSSQIGQSSHVHVMDERSTPVLGKQIFPSAYNVVRWQGYEMQFDRPRNLQRIRVNLLDFDESPYPLHGREMSFSILLTANPLRE